MESLMIKKKNDLSLKLYENKFTVYKFLPNDLSLEIFQDGVKQDIFLTSSQKDIFLEKSNDKIINHNYK